MIKYGKENLYNDFIRVVNSINDINENYYINVDGVSKELSLLFDFENIKDFMEQFNHVSIKKLKEYIKIFVENIYRDLNVENSYISQCLYNKYNYEYRDLKLSLRHVSFSNGIYNRLEFGIMTYQKNSGCGNGTSLVFDLIDINTFNETKDIINKMDVPNSIKKMYNYHLDEYHESDLSLVKREMIENIIEYINEFLIFIEEDYAKEKSLFNQFFAEVLTDFIQTHSFMKDIADAITVGHKEIDSVIDENTIEIKFLNEIIKTISKTSHVIYKIQ